MLHVTVKLLGVQGTNKFASAVLHFPLPLTRSITCTQGRALPPFALVLGSVLHVQASFSFRPKVPKREPITFTQPLAALLVLFSHGIACLMHLFVYSIYKYHLLIPSNKYTSNPHLILVLAPPARFRLLKQSPSGIAHPGLVELHPEPGSSAAQDGLVPLYVSFGWHVKTMLDDTCARSQYRYLGARCLGTCPAPSINMLPAAHCQPGGVLNCDLAL